MHPTPSRAQTSAGTVVAWDNNGSNETDVPLILTNAVAIARGLQFSLALNANGSVVAWGDNSDGQTNVPPGLTNVVGIACGSYQSLALKNDGTVVAWGDNYWGEASVPPGLSNVVAIAGGYGESEALKNDGTVVAWGGFAAAIPPEVTNIVSIAIYGNEGLALTGDGTVIYWGSPPGAGPSYVLSTVAGNVAALSPGGPTLLKGDGTVLNGPTGLSNVVAVAPDLALKNDGTVVGLSGNMIPAGLSNVVAVSDASGYNMAIVTADSNNDTLAYLPQPQKQTPYIGASFNLYATVIGSPPLYYQWLLDGTNVSGATNASLTLTNVEPANDGDYSVVVSNQSSAITGSNVALTALVCPPIIVFQSPNQLALLGTNLTIAVTATGPVPMSYQWQFNGTNILGATNASFGITNFQVINEGNYTVVVSNAFYSTTSAGTFLTAADLAGALNARYLSWGNGGYFNRPWWYWQTAYTHDGIAAARSGAVGNGGKSSLDTTVNGPGTLSFWWMISSDVPDLLTFSVNGTEEAYLYDGDPYQNIDWYQFSIYLPAGTQNLDWTYARNSSVNVGLSAGVLDQVSYIAGPTLPIITIAPTNQSISATGSATFTVAAAGTPPLAYQWQFNGIDIDGATNTSLTLTELQAPNAGVYSAVVSNPYGTNTPSATLTVIPVPPQIVTQPVNQRVPENGVTTFSVTATGSTPFTYQWQFNGTNIDGATNATIMLTGVQPSNAGSYQAVVSNGYGTTNSAVAILTVARLIAWGYNTLGQTTIPMWLTNAASVAGGLYHSMALNFDGTVTAWGNNEVGQIDIPTNLSNVVAIAAGFDHNLALESNGMVIAWGAGTNNTGLSPNYGQSQVPAALTNVVAVAGGGYHSLALKDDGTVVAWGAGTNSAGLNPNYGQSRVPAGLSDVVAIAGGGYHSLALKSDGRVVAWGAGTNNTGVTPNYGQSEIPANLSNVVAIAAGVYHSMALKNDGTVVAWGNDLYGQTNVPAGLTNVAAIACGGYHNLAIKTDGSLVTWGNNIYGQTNVPVGLSSVVAIAGGTYHSLAIMNDGTPFVIRETPSQTVSAGANVLLTTTVLGAPVLEYQWQVNGTNLDGATNAYITFRNLPTTSSGSYQCIISNIFGTVTNAPVNLNVLRTIPIFATTSSTLNLGGAGFNLQLDDLSGHGPVIIYASTNLTDWRPIFTNPPVVGALQIPDSSATNLPFQFYRGVEQ